MFRRPRGFGAVAQLGERGLCKPEVVGSIPISSTRLGRDGHRLEQNFTVGRDRRRAAAVPRER